MIFVYWKCLLQGHSGTQKWKGIYLGHNLIQITHINLPAGTANPNIKTYVFFLAKEHLHT